MFMNDDHGCSLFNSILRDPIQISILIFSLLNYIRNDDDDDDDSCTFYIFITYNLKTLLDEMNDVLGGGIWATFAKTFLNMLFNVFTNSGAVYYSQELKAVAEQANLPLGLLAFMQLSYELFACCTSIVKENCDGFP